MKKLFTKTKVLTGFPMALLCCLLTFGWSTTQAQSGGLINDNCSGAIVLTPSATCTTIGGSVAGATQSVDTDFCEGTPNDDVWYSFTAVSSDAVITVTPTDPSTVAPSLDLVVDVLSGSCGSLASVANCIDGTGRGAAETVTLTTLTVGQVYYVRVYHYYTVASSPSGFNICLVSSAPCDMAANGDGQWPGSSITPDAGGAVTTISTSNYAGSEYSVVTAMVSGDYYELTHSAGSYITVREGVVAGPVVASGFSPLGFTATSASDIYVHWTLDGDCAIFGAGSGNNTTTVQNQGAPPCDMAANGDGQWPGSSITPDAGGAVTTIATNSYGGSEYSVVAGLNGHEYSFTHANGAYITVRTGAVDGTVLGAGFSPLVIQASSTGNLYVHWTADDACAVDATGSFLTTVQDLGVPPCDNSPLAFSLYPASPITPDAGGAVTTITTDQYVGSEYSVITGVQASSNYEFTHAAGSYITVRVGAVDGPVLGSGFSPLQVAAVTTDDLYVHWTADEFCDVDATGSHLTTVQFLGAACLAEAGTLTPVDAQVCLAAAIEAVEDNAPVVPVGYALVYVVTQDPNLTVVAGPLSTPTYTPTVAGTYTIHAMVIDPADQGTILAEVPNGGAAVAALFEENGGTLCGSLDVTGATFNVVVCPDNDECVNAEPIACGDVVSGSTVNGSLSAEATNAGIGVWYQFEGTGEDVTFSTCGAATFDTEITVFTGQCGSLAQEAFNDDFTGCAGSTSSLDVYTTAGTTYYVYVSHFSNFSSTTGTFDLSVTCNCTADAGTLTAVESEVCLVAGGTVDISATENLAPTLPGAEYSVTYVLTSNPGLIIEQVNTTPDFTVDAGGEYTIHTLVSSSTLDLTGVVLGVTPAGDVVNTVVTNGICAALDVTGAVITVVAPNSGTITADAASCYDGIDDVTITGTPDGNQFVPTGYETGYALTEAGVVTQVGASASFDVSATGDYTIHTFVYPTGFPVGTAVGQPAGVVNGLLVQGGGNACAALDLTGATITVVACPPVGINVALENSLSVYPNPSNGQFVVEVNGVDADAQIIVMDVAGRQVYTEGVIMNGSFRKELNLNVASGTYLLQINTVEGKVTRKIQIN